MAFITFLLHLHVLNLLQWPYIICAIKQSLTVTSLTHLQPSVPNRTRVRSVQLLESATQSSVTVSVHSGPSDGTPSPRGLSTAHVHSSRFGGWAVSDEDAGRVRLCWGPASRFLDSDLSPVVSLGGRCREPSGNSFIRTLIPSMRALPFMTQSPP